MAGKKYPHGAPKKVIAKHQISHTQAQARLGSGNMVAILECGHAVVGHKSALIHDHAICPFESRPKKEKPPKVAAVPVSERVLSILEKLDERLSRLEGAEQPKPAPLTNGAAGHVEPAPEVVG